ncbi:MAG: transporter [Muribaculaceae bacterium]|nr:transporter [Muribaculaceae bacterium]
MKVPSTFLQRLKPWMLPIAMLGGILFHNFIDAIAFIAPYLIFIMLLITFCKVNPREFRLTRLSGGLIAVQMIGSIAIYLALRPVSEQLAQGTFICIFCPTATAAPVITGMLGGSVARLATFSIVSNVCVAVSAPILFTLMGSESGLTFVQSLTLIAVKVVPMIILPLVTAMAMRKLTPKAHHVLATRQGVSFYIWAVSLFIVVGRAVSFVMNEPPEAIPEMVCLALMSAIACCGQFYIGRRIGARCGDKIAGAQGLGQKNTVLAIWMALTYLSPISSVAPAAYVAWQNTINSAQLYYKTQKESRENKNRHRNVER